VKPDRDVWDAGQSVEDRFPVLVDID